MDSRAKQRVTGAIILVALFVLLVPELLKGPRVADAPEGAPTDEGMRRYTIDLDASAPPAQPDNSSAQPAVALPEVADDRAKPGDEAAPVASSQPVAPNAVAAAPKPASPSPQAPTQSAPTPAPSTQTASTPAPTRAAAPPAERGSFVVQLGSFHERENADRLVREMTAKGFAAFVATPIKSGGRDLYRVRVGPTRDRAQAEALAVQLQRVGQSGSIVPIS